MGLFNDTVTIYHKFSDDQWSRQVVRGVQWSDHEIKSNENGRVSISRYASVTFPEGTYEGLYLAAEGEEDAIVYGECDFIVLGLKGSRISDLLELFPRSGRIYSVRHNDNKTHLKNMKVTIR